MCADIHDGQEHKRSVEGRIQKRKTNHLQIITFGLQRTAGPYKGATSGLSLSWADLQRCDLVAFEPEDELEFDRAAREFPP